MHRHESPALPLLRIEALLERFRRPTLELTRRELDTIARTVSVLETERARVLELLALGEVA